MRGVVGEAIGPREPHARLRALMEHHVDAVEQWLDGTRTQVCFDEFESIGAMSGGEVGLFRRAVVVRREAVEPEHGLAARDERVDEGRSDEAGGAGDERAHGVVTTRRCRG